MILEVTLKRVVLIADREIQLPPDPNGASSQKFGTLTFFAGPPSRGPGPPSFFGGELNLC